MKKVIFLLILICLFMLSAWFPTGQQLKPVDFSDINQSIQSSTKFVDMELGQNLLLQADATIHVHQQCKLAIIAKKTA